MKHLNLFRTVLLLTVTLAIREITAQPTANNNRWDLNRYVWSHGHHDNPNGKPMLDYPVIDNWPGISNDGLLMSNDGHFIAYGVKNLKNGQTDSFVVQSLDGKWRQKLRGGINAVFFSADNKKYVYGDKDKLCYLDVGSGEIRYVQNVLSFF